MMSPRRSQEIVEALLQRQAQVLIADLADRDFPRTGRTAGGYRIGRHDTSFAALPGGRRRAPTAQRYSRDSRVGQSLMRVSVIVWSGEYCGNAHSPAARPRSGRPCGGSLKRVENSSATIGARSARTASMTSPSHDRPAQRRTPCRARLSPGSQSGPPGNPIARSLAFSGNRMASASAPPRDSSGGPGVRRHRARSAISRAEGTGVASSGAAAIHRVRPL